MISCAYFALCLSRRPAASPHRCRSWNRFPPPEALGRLQQQVLPAAGLIRGGPGNLRIQTNRLLFPFILLEIIKYNLKLLISSWNIFSLFDLSSPFLKILSDLINHLSICGSTSLYALCFIISEIPLFWRYIFSFACEFIQSSGNYIRQRLPLSLFFYFRFRFYFDASGKALLVELQEVSGQGLLNQLIELLLW